jgi:hypothetical protein
VGAPGNLVPLIADEADESLYSVVTEPMILRLPSRIKCLFSISLHPQYTEQEGKMAIRTPLKRSDLRAGFVKYSRRQPVKS